MKRAGVRVGTGTRFIYDGQVIEIVEMPPVAGMPGGAGAGSPQRYPSVACC